MRLVLCRGVVRLFNAVSKAQTVEKEASDGKHKGKTAASMKSSFLAELRGQAVQRPPLVRQLPAVLQLKNSYVVLCGLRGLDLQNSYCSKVRQMQHPLAALQVFQMLTGCLQPWHVLRIKLNHVALNY